MGDIKDSAVSGVLASGVSEIQVAETLGEKSADVEHWAAGHSGSPMNDKLLPGAPMLPAWSVGDEGELHSRFCEDCNAVLCSVCRDSLVHLGHTMVITEVCQDPDHNLNIANSVQGKI